MKEKIKPPLSNWEIISKYQKSREKIKKYADELLEVIEDEKYKLGKLNSNFDLNEKNQKLLNSKSEKVLDFKFKLIKIWKDTLAETEDQQSKESSEAFLKDIEKIGGLKKKK